MMHIDRDLWDSYCMDADFQAYLEVCTRFDPIGFGRAIKQDEAAQKFEFRRVIIEAYLEDRRMGVYS